MRPINRILFVKYVSCIITILFAVSAVEAHYYYFFPPEDEYADIFEPSLIRPPSQSYPLIFILTRHNAADNTESAITFLRKNKEYWTIPESNEEARSFITGRFIEGMSLRTSSHSIPVQYIEWDQEAVNKRTVLFQAFNEKREYLRFHAARLDAILSRWMMQHYPPDYNNLQKLIRQFSIGNITIETFIEKLSELAQNNNIDIEQYPAIAACTKTLIHNPDISLHYSTAQLTAEKNDFNTELLTMHDALSPEQMQLIIDHIIQGHLSLEQYKQFVDMMHAANIERYPVYSSHLCRLAWRSKMHTIQFQEELDSMVAALYLATHPGSELDEIKQWISFSDMLLKFTNGTITLSEYKFLGQMTTPSYSGDIPEHKKILLNELDAFWDDTLQKKLSEALQSFFKYVSLYRAEFTPIKEAAYDQKANVIFLIGDKYDEAAFFFWFALGPTGAVVRINPHTVVTDTDNERYFELMRGHKSHFEKLLEGIGDTQ